MPLEIKGKTTNFSFINSSSFDASRIPVLQDVTTGVNPLVFEGSYDCRYNLASTPFTGAGAVVVDVNIQDRYIQNETITNTRTYIGRDIYFGEKVTTTKSQGPAKINPGASLVANASHDILLDCGFEAALGCTFEMR